MTRPVILVSNDDGIEAPGLEALVSALRAVGEVWVVAPDGERSTSSHALTLGSPVPVREAGERAFAVDGWPADCAYLGLFALLPREPDVVVSGINRGSNLGTDVLYSGTVGAAREAYTRKIPSIAASLVRGKDFSFAAQFVSALVRAVLDREGTPLLLNVNVPGATADGVRVTTLGRRYYPGIAEVCGTRGEFTLYMIAPGGELHDALIPGSDGEADDDGLISVTPLGIEGTIKKQFKEVKGLVQGAWKEIKRG